MAQKESKKAKTLESKKLQQERVVFATLVYSLANGSIDELLKNAPVGVCEEFGRVWDEQGSVPVSVLFQRPKFEEYEALHREIQVTEN